MSDRPAPAVLEAEDLSFAYGHELVLDGVNLAVAPGEFVALVGPNGSGKSTLLRCLLGLLPPAAGTVRLFGAAPTELTDRWRLGYVPQRGAVARELPATVEEVVGAGRLARSGWRRRFRPEDRTEIEHAMASAMCRCRFTSSSMVIARSAAASCCIRDFRDASRRPSTSTSAPAAIPRRGRS